MACRIKNLGKHRLALDLRGGQVLYLQPNEVSQPLREEWLYGNIHLPKWIEQGLVLRMDSRMADVLEYEAAASAGGAAPAKESKDARDKEDGEAAADASDKRAETKHRGRPGKEGEAATPAADKRTEKDHRGRSG